MAEKLSLNRLVMAEDQKLSWRIYPDGEPITDVKRVAR